MTQKCRRAAHLAYEKDITNREAARRMGVAESTFYRYLRLYRNGTYC
jgi:transposase-like protein